MRNRIWITEATENLLEQGMGTLEALIELKRITSQRLIIASDGLCSPRVVDGLLDDLHLIDELIKIYAEDID